MEEVGIVVSLSLTTHSGCTTVDRTIDSRGQHHLVDLFATTQYLEEGRELLARGCSYHPTDFRDDVGE